VEHSTTMTSPSPAAVVPTAGAPSHRRARRFKDAPLELVRHVLREPGRSATFAIALAKGHLYKAWCRVRGARFSAGRGLAIYGRLSVRGPGAVALGHDVAIYGRVNAWTYGREARITIGDNVMMSSAKIGCAQSVHIGSDCIVAESSIRDTDFHSVRVDRRRPEAPIRVAPVRVEDNVWIASQAILLPGTTIGRNCVVGAAAVCMRAFPPDKVILGNPAKVAMPVPTPRDDALATELAADADG
jgi:acetyltransferase-like isoleucine patch superfamily enzyme